MDFMDVVKARRSIRRYRPNPVPQEDIDYVLEAARLAPSWANTQCWHFVVVTDEDIKQRVAEAGAEWGTRWIRKAPVLIAVCADPDLPGYKDDIANYLVDIGIVVEHLVLAATDRGLGTCWIGGFWEDPVKEILGVPEGHRVVALTPLGYPDEAPPPRRRKELAEIASYDRYGAKR